MYINAMLDINNLPTEYSKSGVVIHIHLVACNSIRSSMPVFELIRSSEARPKNALINPVATARPNDDPTSDCLRIQTIGCAIISRRHDFNFHGFECGFIQWTPRALSSPAYNNGVTR